MRAIDCDGVLRNSAGEANRNFGLRGFDRALSSGHGSRACPREGSMNLVERVKAIVLTPRTEWPVIAAEPGDAAYLFRNYVAILAAIPAVAGLIGGLSQNRSFGIA